MNPEKLKYILDIESVISEVEHTLTFVNHDFTTFCNNSIAIRAVERNIEIIGEAVKKLRDLNVDLPHNTRIIGMQNIIAHAYDTVDNELLWNIITHHIPELKKEITKLRS